LAYLGKKNQLITEMATQKTDTGKVIKWFLSDTRSPSSLNKANNNNQNTYTYTHLPAQGSRYMRRASNMYLNAGVVHYNMEAYGEN
jgi:hypothetical protein